MNDELPPEPNDAAPSESLLSLNLGIGDALQLQETSGAQQRYYATLIGFLNKQSVIVSHPVKNGALLPVQTGQSFQVRGFSGRKTYEFDASVMSSGEIPYPHLHLSFPERVASMTMRGALRIKPKSLAGWIEPVDGDFTVVKTPMIFVDLSTSGARVQAKKQFGNIGDEVKVLFNLPVDGEKYNFLIPALIRKSYNETLDDNLGGEVVTHGLEFIQPEGNVRMALQSFIYKTMAEG